MTVTSYRSHEPLYIVTIRHPNAVKLIESWIQKTNASVTQESHRIKIHDYRHLNLFLLEWPHGWNNVVVWDCWNKRHIYVDN
jgi:hypothetical protein